MRKKIRLLLLPVLVLALGCLSLLSTLALAQPSGGPYTIVKSTIDGGGGSASGGAYTLRGTIGQPDASPQTLSGGTYQLTGGFWSALAQLPGLIFKDGFESD